MFNYTDNDQGINAQATFTTVEFPEPLTANNQTFKITPDGKLVLTKQLHPKIQRMYKVNVTASMFNEFYLLILYVNVVFKYHFSLSM